MWPSREAVVCKTAHEGASPSSVFARIRRPDLRPEATRRCVRVHPPVSAKRPGDRSFKPTIRVRVPVRVLSSGCSSAWESAWFGTRRPSVRLRLSRLRRVHRLVVLDACLMSTKLWFDSTCTHPWCRLRRRRGRRGHGVRRAAMMFNGSIRRCHRRRAGSSPAGRLVLRKIGAFARLSPGKSGFDSRRDRSWFGSSRW